ncbi:MAG: HTH domain-containing protein [Myxococcales bacterium]|nr:HTH domain-containing protein [Myxococcales bacterium]
MRRTERLLAIAEHLRARRTGITAEALAERFGVTARTMYRDLASLRAASLPIGADRGRGGGFALDRHYTLPPVNFTAREAAVLIAAAQWVGAMRVTPFTETLERGVEKVRAALGASAQRELLTLLGALQHVGVPARPTDASVRAAVERGWFEQRPLRVTYRSAGGAQTERTVRIRSLVMDGHEVRLHCDDLDRGEARELRLHAIVRARVVPLGQGEREPPAKVDRREV